MEEASLRACSPLTTRPVDATSLPLGKLCPTVYCVFSLPSWLLSSCVSVQAHSLDHSPRLVA